MALLRLRPFGALVLSSVMTLAAAAQTIQKDIAYVTDTSGAQKADLYEPAGYGPFPAIVYIHGGSWRSGNKKDFRQLATDLSAKGYVGFSINYDLAPHAFPISWQEGIEAVRFLRAHAMEYHINPKRIAVAGASAGGELAALLALAPQGPASVHNAEETPVEAAVILSGVFDLGGSYGVIARYIGGPCDKVAEACRDSSPMKHIHRDTPPFFVGHGSGDHTVPYASAQLFTSAMQVTGNDVTFYSADKGPHMYFKKKAYYSENLVALESFLADALASPPTRHAAQTQALLYPLAAAAPLSAFAGR